MGTAKFLELRPISFHAARQLVLRFHYSGKIVNNSILHLGVFLSGRLQGVMSFGPPTDKRKLINLVKGTSWNGFLELNRMAFNEDLPRNAESRALSVAFRLIKKRYPQVGWIVSFSDGTQSGDGAIYRAAGFLLTGITRNKSLYLFPNGEVLSAVTITASWDSPKLEEISKTLGIPLRYRTVKEWQQYGAKPLPGYQFRYVRFLDPGLVKKLSVPVIPFSKIEEIGGSMYRGQKIVRVK